MTQFMLCDLMSWLCKGSVKVTELSIVSERTKAQREWGLQSWVVSAIHFPALRSERMAIYI